MKINEVVHHKKKKKHCSNCRGLGFIPMHNAFCTGEHTGDHSINQTCSSCGGTGVVSSGPSTSSGASSGGSAGAASGGAGGGGAGGGP